MTEHQTQAVQAHTNLLVAVDRLLDAADAVRQERRRLAQIIYDAAQSARRIDGAIAAAESN